MDGESVTFDEKNIVKSVEVHSTCCMVLLYKNIENIEGLTKGEVIRSIDAVLKLSYF